MTSLKTPAPDGRPSSRMLNYVALCVLFFGIVIAFFFGTGMSGKATVFMWMFACILASSVIGFLFGIPKILQTPAKFDTSETTLMPSYQQLVNSNLTEISDWLTKIIVGLGLVNLTKIPPYLYDAARILANGLTSPQTMRADLALAFAYAIIIGFSCFGFLFGYIGTRTYLAGIFSSADQNTLKALADSAKETAGKAQSALRKAELALSQPLDISDNNALTAEAKLTKLVEAYNHVRNSMESGNARTSKAVEVIKAMFLLSPHLKTFDVEEALKSSNNGSRISGFAYLYTKPDFKHIDSLVNAIISDPTNFGQYWGIQALRSVLDTKQGLSLDEKLEDKLIAYYNSLRSDTDRKWELAKILKIEPDRSNI
jgi:hypothetical protein